MACRWCSILIQRDPARVGRTVEKPKTNGRRAGSTGGGPRPVGTTLTFQDLASRLPERLVPYNMPPPSVFQAVSKDYETAPQF